MKEVFEKIVEILENKANEAEKDMQLSDSYADAQAFGGKQEGYENAIEIVKQEAEEHNNGWIPCSDRFPKVEDLHEKSVDDCTCYLIQRRYGSMDVAHYIKVYAEQYFEANAIKIKDIVAWQPLPDPYQPNACQDTNCPYNDRNECPAADGCAGYERKQTNAERVRSMSDEELAGSRVDRIDYYAKSDIPEYIGDFAGIANSIEEAIALEIKWLQSEVEE